MEEAIGMNKDDVIRWLENEASRLAEAANTLRHTAPETPEQKIIGDIRFRTVGGTGFRASEMARRIGMKEGALVDFMREHPQLFSRGRNGYWTMEQ